ncbi:MAG: YdiU family protein [Verrucomicrobiae bacterium]|nr:YdiU family protein [Verrucomicrobiae bacterium]
MERHPSATTDSLIRPEGSQPGWRFDNSYARLPGTFFARVNPTPVAAPRVVVFNRGLAEELGLNPEAFANGEAAAWLTGNAVPEGAEPIAQAYAGHQFGHLARLGDGRAILLGEHLTPSRGRVDIQLKGPGPTPYSRRGDGRAALGPMLREYLVSEAMHALGIPTTRSLAVAATGEPVFRERALPGAVLTRVAASHIRVGTFEYFAALGDVESLRVLAEYTLRRHFPDRLGADEPILGLLEEAVERQARLIAAWMRVGFVHGVMNTDNMAVSGETIDYGPCAFVDAYDPGTVFSSIDHQGRYALSQQPAIAAWNLARFAEALLPLFLPDPNAAVPKVQAVLDTFQDRYRRHARAARAGKLGLLEPQVEDDTLFEELLDWMHREAADHTQTFRELASRVTRDPGGSRVADSQEARTAARIPPEPWRNRWQERLAAQGASPEAVMKRMNAHNPAVIPRNHVVEEVLEAATERQDLAPFLDVLRAVSRPYDEDGQPDRLRHAPPPGTPRCRTFCGT